MDRQEQLESDVWKMKYLFDSLTGIDKDFKSTRSTNRYVARLCRQILNNNVVWNPEIHKAYNEYVENLR